MSSPYKQKNQSIKEFASKNKKLLIFAFGITIFNVIVFSTLTNLEQQQPNPLPLNTVPPVPNEFLVLDKMNCNDIMSLTDNMMKTGDWKFNNDLNQDAYKSYAFGLRNQCLGSVSQYEMLIDSAGNHKYLVNGNWVHLEMTHQ